MFYRRLRPFTPVGASWRYASRMRNDSGPPRRTENYRRWSHSKKHSQVERARRTIDLGALAKYIPKPRSGAGG